VTRQREQDFGPEEGKWLKAQLHYNTTGGLKRQQPKAKDAYKRGGASTKENHSKKNPPPFSTKPKKQKKPHQKTTPTQPKTKQPTQPTTTAPEWVLVGGGGGNRHNIDCVLTPDHQKEAGSPVTNTRKALE